MNFEIELQEKLNTVNTWIEELLPQGDGYHKKIFEAADYSVKNGGKRIRPVICLAVCEMLGGNIMTDAFGVVAMIAMTPLITIQVLGLSGSIRRRSRLRKAYDEFIQIEDDIIYFDGEENV